MNPIQDLIESGIAVEEILDSIDERYRTRTKHFGVTIYPCRYQTVNYSMPRTVDLDPHTIFDYPFPSEDGSFWVRIQGGVHAGFVAKVSSMPPELKSGVEGKLRAKGLL